MPRSNKREKAKYQSAPGARLCSIGMGERNERFYVEFANVEMAGSYGRGFTRSKPAFIARDNARKLLTWADNQNITDCSAAGNKAFFASREDATLCRVAFA